MSGPEEVLLQFDLLALKSRGFLVLFEFYLSDIPGGNRTLTLRIRADSLTGPIVELRPGVPAEITINMSQTQNGSGIFAGFVEDRYVTDPYTFVLTAEASRSVVIDIDAYAQFSGIVSVNHRILESFTALTPLSSNYKHRR